jgi:hypothetical protein
VRSIGIWVRTEVVSRSAWESVASHPEKEALAVRAIEIELVEPRPDLDRGQA